MYTINHVSTRDFAAEVVDSEIPVLVDFYADWCGPCRMIAPMLEGLAREYAGQVKFLKVNVDQEPALAQHFRVRSIPTLMAFQGGRLVDTLVGIGSPAQLRQIVSTLCGRSGQPTLRAR